MKNLKDGFTLAELLIVVAIFAVIIVGMLQLFAYTKATAEIAGNKTIAVIEASNKIEEIRNYSFSGIATAYASGGNPGNTFDLTSITGKGIIYIDSSNSELLELRVVVSWKDRYNRVVGEDQDLDGTLDTGEGEDVNGDGRLSSPVEVMALITRK